MEDIILYDQALTLKELGFDLRCTFYYENGKPKIYSKSLYGWNSNTSFLNCCSAPTYSKAFKWFRDKHKLDKTIDNWDEQPMDGEVWDKAYQYYINGEAFHPYFKTYEEAEKACLNKLIELLKNK